MTKEISTGGAAHLLQLSLALLERLSRMPGPAGEEVGDLKRKLSKLVA